MKKNKILDIDIGEIKILKFKSSKEIIIDKIIDGKYNELIKSKINEPKHVRLMYHTDVKPKEIRYLNIEKQLLDIFVFKGEKQ